MDYPLVRSIGTCPLCRKRKDAGLVACWSCFRAYGLRYRNPEAERRLEQAEAEVRDRSE